MFNYTFRMYLSRLTSIESYFAFLFKAYIKQSQIWDILATFKMELFMTTSICKVVFYRLMILCTQYWPMSVFICVNSLLVPSVPCDFTSKHLCDNNYCWCCIILGNDIVCTVSSYEFLVFLCLFVAECILLQVVPGSSSSFLVLVCVMVPAGSLF